MAKPFKSALNMKVFLEKLQENLSKHEEWKDDPHALHNHGKLSFKEGSHTARTKGTVHHLFKGHKGETKKFQHLKETNKKHRAVKEGATKESQ